jgi:hypothetical protein
MGLAIDRLIEIDRNRQVDLIFAPRSTADRSMDVAIEPNRWWQEVRHV